MVLICSHLNIPYLCNLSVLKMNVIHDKNKLEDLNSNSVIYFIYSNSLDNSIEIILKTELVRIVKIYVENNENYENLLILLCF